MKRQPACARRRLRRLCRLLLVPSLVLLPACADAHYDPEEVIAELNVRIEAGDHEPRLYYARAVEWRVLARYPEATADLKKALELDAEFLPAHMELARLLALQGSFADAAGAARKAIGIGGGETPFVQAQCRAVLARVEMMRKEFGAALTSINEALRLHPAGESEWYQLQATAHRRLGRHSEAIKCLKRGFDRSRSGVLRNAWLDALLDGGRGAEALPVIEAELAARPLKSSWLIRRARVRIGLQQPEAAREDLRAALAEVEKRILPEDPDVRLLMDRAMASLLLGQRQQALDDLQLAREKRIVPELLEPLENLLAANTTVGAAPSK